MTKGLWYQVNGKLQEGGQPPDEVIQRIPYAGERTTSAALAHARDEMRAHKRNSSSIEVVAVVNGDDELVARITFWDVF